MDFLNSIYWKWFLLLLVFAGCRVSKEQKQSITHVEVQESVDSVFFDSVMLSVKDTLHSSFDTVLVNKNIYINIYDTLLTYKGLQIDTNGVIYIQYFDSLVTVNDTLVSSIDTLYSTSEKVLMRLENFVEKENLVAKLLRNVVRFEKKPSGPPPPVEQNEKKFEEYNDRYIRSVKVVVLDVFGPNVNDPERRPQNLLEKSGNFFHISTRKKLIKNTLLFKKGDKINSFVVSENERLLRQNNYIFDSKIKLIGYDEGKDSVDVIVYVQDVWSKSVGATFDPPMKGLNVSAGDANFLGLGTSLSNTVKLSPLLPNFYNYIGNLSISNIGRSFFTGHGQFLYENGQKRFGGSVNREFISPAIKWAGGVSSFWVETGHFPPNINEAPLPLMHLNQQDAWIGYSNNLFDDEKARLKGNRFVLAARYMRNEYTIAPPDHYNTHFLLSSVGYINTRYYRDKYIFRFGRPEDFAEGELIALVGGRELTLGKYWRPYFGINSAWSRYNKYFGYFYINASLGSFRNGDVWEQGALMSRLLYFTPIIKLNRWKTRYFLGCRYTEGIRSMPGQFINISNEMGIRGLSSHELMGTRKAVINFEANMFPPINVLGFRMAFVYFTDLAWISSEHNLFSSKNFFSAYGVGFRFRNEHLIFNTIQILFGYYPGARDIGLQEFQLFERSRFYYTFNEFQFPKPSVVPFF